MLETLNAVNLHLSRIGHQTGAMPVELSRLKTQEEAAAEMGCSTRTVRRKAEALGWRKFNGYIIDNEEIPHNECHLHDC